VSGLWPEIGHPVLYVHTLSRINVKNSIECIASASKTLILVIDSFADHVEQIAEILRDQRTEGKLLVLAADRSYRKNHIDTILGVSPYIYRYLFNLEKTELLHLIESYRQLGLIGVDEGLHDPDGFALKLALGLAPYVNRTAVMKRTPEARLARRLLDADKVVKPHLGARADELYELCKPKWAWNSRFWEQRALLIVETNLATALQYARHAVAIERHPFTLTTLGKILFREMEFSAPIAKSSQFAEAFECLSEAIDKEGFTTRVAVHPFVLLFRGTIQFLEIGGRLTQHQQKALDSHMGNAEFHFKKDAIISQLLDRLEQF
jgi:hypothetical protein